MIPLWKSFGLAVALVVAHGCFGERIAGNSSETENTASARLVLVDPLLHDWNRSARQARLPVGSCAATPSPGSVSSFPKAVNFGSTISDYTVSIQMIFVEDKRC